MIRISIASSLLLTLAACASNSAVPPDQPGEADAGGLAGVDAASAAPDAARPGGCSTGPDGLACIVALYDEVVAGCDSTRFEDLFAAFDGRRGELPVWSDGRALFVTWGSPATIAGAFNGWAESTDVSNPVCNDSRLHVANLAIVSGSHPYKLVRDGVWSLDPDNWAFAFDDFAGNPDGKNSLLNTYDSGVGHLVQPTDPVCSDDLSNCRPLTSYLPPGYGAPENAARSYPVVFMHDGQNIFDDTDCCFGHTGWEVNRTLDSEIQAGFVEPVVIVGFDHAGGQRIDEYGFSSSVGGMQETFMAFQISEVQPHAASLWRIDMARTYTAGSSLGGLISFRLAFAYPHVYAGAASISGAFWPGQDTDTAMRDIVTDIGYVPVALYMDHGGMPETGADGYQDNNELRDLLGATGWAISSSPDCAASPTSVCYHWEPGATHDELAWRDRSWRFLRYLLPGESL